MFLLRRREIFIECFFVLLATLVAASTYKQIWVDELLGFAFAGFESFPEMLRAMHSSFRDLNVGQTGFLFVTNYVLLKLFGASYFVLRLPSYLAYVASLWYFSQILRGLAVPLAMRLFFLTWLALSGFVFAMAIDARPYILIQATVVAFLYYLLPSAEDPRYLRLRGFFCSALLGILYHPYFGLYGGAAVALALLFFPGMRLAVREHWRLRPLFFLSGLVLLAALFLGLGYFSWAVNVGQQGSFDPFFYIGRDRSLVRVVFGALFFPFQFFVLGVLVALPSGFFLWRASKLRNFVAPAREVFALLGDRSLLFFLSLLVLTQVVLIRQSLASGYWILQRQWIAGFPLAMIWLAIFLRLFFEAWNAGRFRALSARAVVPAMILASLVFGYRLYGNWRAPRAGSAYSQVEFEKLLTEHRIEQFEALAHHNLMMGGPVHPGFAFYYRRSPPRPLLVRADKRRN